MRTRLPGLVLLLALLFPAASITPAFAAPATDTVVLAAEGGAGEPQGPEPRTADDPDNEFRPKDYEEPWTYWLGVFILVGTIPALLLAGYLYFVLVHYHRRKEEPAKAGSR